MHTSRVRSWCRWSTQLRSRTFQEDTADRPYPPPSVLSISKWTERSSNAGRWVRTRRDIFNKLQKIFHPI